MRSAALVRLQEQAAALDPDLPPLARKAVIQLLWIKDVLEAYHGCIPVKKKTAWDRAIISSCIHAASPTNPKLSEFFK